MLLSGAATAAAGLVVLIVARARVLSDRQRFGLAVELTDAV